jgi:hypothetical protein
MVKTLITWRLLGTLIQADNNRIYLVEMVVKVWPGFSWTPYLLNHGSTALYGPRPPLSEVTWCCAFVEVSWWPPHWPRFSTPSWCDRQSHLAGSQETWVRNGRLNFYARKVLYRRKWCSGFLSPLKTHRPRSGSNPRTLGPVASTLTTSPPRSTVYILWACSFIFRWFVIIIIICTVTRTLRA